jgi:hypothetical protein
MFTRGTSFTISAAATADRDRGRLGLRRSRRGIDINPVRVKESQDNAKAAGVTDRVVFRNEDLFEADIREATVVTLYLLPSLNVKLRPKLLQDLKVGARIVSHQFDMGDWKPEKTVAVDWRSVYFWTVTEKAKQEFGGK